MKRFLNHCLLVTLLALVTSLLYGQSAITGDLTGTVTDPTGAVLPNTAVVLKNLQTGESQTASTNSQGQYRFSFLKPGTYSATVDAQGFKSTTLKGNVSLGQVTALNLQASLAGASESVDVTAEAQLLQNDNANLATTFDSSLISNLPSPGNDTTAYAFTAPGVTASSGGGYGNFSAYGLPSNANLFTVNGNDNNDPYLNLNNSGASNLTLGANELQEVAIVENAYSVQYGRNAGAQVNSVTKSGTNQYHGNASYWYNSKAFNANDWFFNHAAPGMQTPRPHAVNHQYAASIGGHIIKNKLFFYVDHEGLRYVLPGSSTPTYLPTPQLASYVLGNIAVKHPNEVPFYQNIFNLYAGAPGANRAVPTGGALSGCGKDFSTANPSFASPCTESFLPSNNNLNTEWLLATRLDYNISSTDSIFGRFHKDYGLQATSTDPINPVFSANSIQPQYDGQITETHIFGSTATNQVILSGLWYSAVFGPPNLKAALAVFPTTMSISNTNITQLGGSDYSYPGGRNVTQWMVVDDFSKTAGTHEWKFGANLRRNDVSDYSYGTNTSGTLVFGSLVDFSNGQFGTGGLRSAYSQAFASKHQVPIALYSVAFYGQDQWKPRSDLNITYGLRIDRNANPKCLTNCFSRPGVPFGSITDPTGTVPYNSMIRTGLSSAFPAVEPIALQPRLGIVYSPKSKTVVRAGIGLFSDLFPATIISRFITNAPNIATFATNPSSTANVLPGDPGSVYAAVANSDSAFLASFANGGTYQSLASSVPGFSRPNINTIANKIANPKYLEYNLQVEQGIGNRTSVSLNYVGDYGYDEFIQSRWGNVACLGATSTCPYDGVVPATRPVRSFGRDTELNNHGYSNYNGVTASGHFRIADHLQASLNYTYGHALDTCSNNCLLPFAALTAYSIRGQVSPLGLKQNYGNADYDVRHSINANYLVTVPKRVFNNSLLSSVLSGWSMSQTVYFHTGYPFSVINGDLNSNFANFGSGVNAQLLPDYLGGFKGGACTSPTKGCFGQDISQFADAVQSDFGNRNRNSYRGPGYFDSDLNLAKNFHLTERFVLGVGANMFNLFNHPNFDVPNNDVAGGAINAGGTFGQITTTTGIATSPYGTQIGGVNPAVTGRVIQLNAHIVF